MNPPSTGGRETELMGVLPLPNRGAAAVSAAGRRRTRVDRATRTASGISATQSVKAAVRLVISMPSGAAMNSEPASSAAACHPGHALDRSRPTACTANPSGSSTIPQTSTTQPCLSKIAIRPGIIATKVLSATLSSVLIVRQRAPLSAASRHAPSTAIAPPTRPAQAPRPHHSDDLDARLTWPLQPPNGRASSAPPIELLGISGSGRFQAALGSRSPLGPLNLRHAASGGFHVPDSR